MNDYKILEEKNEIDDHLLDIIGNDFKFDHEKGLAEWIKNSVDAYNRQKTPDSDQKIVLRFFDNDEDAIFECIDFVGMSSDDINKALKRWGDPAAAGRGIIKRTYGGHGNGGKFYMRQMFNRSCFITYKKGLLNIFGFNKDRKYGFADGFRDKRIGIKEAIKIAGIQDLYSDNIYGFTVVRGYKPAGIKGNIKIGKMCEKLKKHPQSMRIMDRIKISVFYDNDKIVDFLRAEKIKPLQGFENPIIKDLPESTMIESGDEKIRVDLSNESKGFNRGKIILRTSELALSSNSKYGDLNRIDIVGQFGVVASYSLREFGVYYPQTDFIYGECVCSILEDENDDCVSNDRVKLVENKKTKAILSLIKEAIEDLCKQISSQEKKDKEENNQRISSDFNNFLNQWKNRFMNKIIGDLFIGQNSNINSDSDYGYGGEELEGSSIVQSSFDGEGGHSDFPPNTEAFDISKGNNDENGDDCKKNDRAKSSHFPRVLLSGHDYDPLDISAENKIILYPSQGLVYQRPQDVNAGIYWINTSSPLADYIIREYGAESIMWRNYLFQRYIDIFIKEALIRIEKKEPERFNANTIDGEIFGKLVTKIHSVASKELNSFLFEESYVLEHDKQS